MNSTKLDGTSPRVDLVEVVKGVSPLEGTVTLAYREMFTQDLAFDASEDEVGDMFPTSFFSAAIPETNRATFFFFFRGSD